MVRVHSEAGSDAEDDDACTEPEGAQVPAEDWEAEECVHHLVRLYMIGSPVKIYLSPLSVSVVPERACRRFLGGLALSRWSAQRLLFHRLDLLLMYTGPKRFIRREKSTCQVTCINILHLMQWVSPAECTIFVFPVKPERNLGDAVTLRDTPMTGHLPVRQYPASWGSPQPCADPARPYRESSDKPSVP